MACGEELAHFVVVLSTLQGQVPCRLHEPYRLSFPGGRGGKGTKLLFCTLDVGKHAVQHTPGGSVEGGWGGECGGESGGECGGKGRGESGGEEH